MIKIKICDVAPRSGCAYYRGLGVFNKLRQLDPQIDVEYVEHISWTVLSDTDILFLLRPCEPSYVEAMEVAQSYGIPVWIDFDDLLTDLPDDNPSLEYYSQEHIQENINYCLKYANMVTFSTVELQKAYSEVRPKSIVIENAFNDYNYSIAQKFNDTKIMSWRGTNTHRKDLLSQKDAFVNISKQFTDWKFFFLGCTPWYITDYMNNAVIQENIDIIKYNRFLINLQPAIHVTPLVDCLFNRCKSNISVLESIGAGAANIGPALPEFQIPGVANYKENFEYLMEKFIKSKKQREDAFHETAKYVKENLLLSKINEKRLEIIRELAKKR